MFFVEVEMLLNYMVPLLMQSRTKEPHNILMIHIIYHLKKNIFVGSTEELLFFMYILCDQ